jgi:hypothetical protein
MKYTTERPYSDPEKAARRILEIANAVEAIKGGRIHVEKINGPFLFRDGGSPAEYGAGMKLAIERGWLGDAQVRHLREVHAGRRRAVCLNAKRAPAAGLRPCLDCGVALGENATSPKIPIVVPSAREGTPTVGKMLQSLEPGARRRVESPLPADAPSPLAGRKPVTGWRPQRVCPGAVSGGASVGVPQ